MSKNLDRIKNALKYSSTMPTGSGGITGGWLMGSAHSHGGGCCDRSHGSDEECGSDHEHKSEGSCCGGH